MENMLYLDNVYLEYCTHEVYLDNVFCVIHLSLLDQYVLSTFL